MKDEGKLPPGRFTTARKRSRALDPLAWARARRDTRKRVLKEFRSFRWYVAVVPPGEEVTAVNLLWSCKVAAFRPVEHLYRRKNHYSKAKELKDFPLMPRYVFVGVKSMADLSFVWTLPIISGILCLDHKPAIVPHDQIAKFVEQGQDFLPPPEHKHMLTKREFKTGETVEVIEGPLVGRLVTVEEISPMDGTAKIFFNLLGARREFHLTLDAMVPIR